MKLVQGNWVRVVVWSLVAAFVAMGFIWEQQAEQREMERLHPELRQMRLRQEQYEAAWAKESAKLGELMREGKTNQVPPLWPGTNRWHSPSTRAEDMTDAQKADLGKKFAEQFRPAVEKWYAAYEGRIRLKPEDVTIDKFESAFGSHVFTFMIDHGELTFFAPGGTNQPARVSSFAIRNAAMTMSRVSSDGTATNLNLPVTTGEIIRMVKADSGVEFKPEEVTIRPMVKAGGLDGGEWVDLLPTGLDPNNALNYKISMVFDADGKLVEYGRAPAF